MDLYYLHGKDSSSNGFRALYLKDHFPQIVTPDLEPDVIKRRAVLGPLIQNPCILVGSSLGGMSALDFAMRFPQKVAAMVLLAPAVGFYGAEYRTPEITAFVDSLLVPAGIPATIIAAANDEVIPLEAIQRMIKRSPEGAQMVYHEVDDNHMLRSEAALAHMVAATQGYLREFTGD